MRELQKKICSGQDVRANLIALKLQLKTDKNQAMYRQICGGNYDPIMKCLVDTDPKVRKNAAAILGIMKVHDAVDVLMDAYLEEDTLFVKSEYVKALSELDCEAYLEDFHKRVDELSNYQPLENEVKHVQEELHTLRELILRKEGLKKHKFTGFQRENEIILTTMPAFRDLLADQILSKKKVLKSGVRTVVGDLNEILSCRIWNEMLFPIHCEGKIAPDAEQIALGLLHSDMMDLIAINHEHVNPFYFRINVTGAMPQENRSDFAKKAAAAIETGFPGRLINSTSHYEVEIRLIQGKDLSIQPYLKFYTIPDHRFDYRRYHVSASMKPTMAAGLLGLMQPYLKEYAQVLDPFCGVGTLLIERRFAGPVRNLYGIDTFGEAIEKARMNTKIAGFQANYINRNYFDFIHDYAFDEIITDMPGGNLTKEELDTVYQNFFIKSNELLTSQGRIMMFSREMGLVKKHLRLSGQFRLLKEFCISEINGAYLFILEKNA